jgi:hypothetical protein
MEYTSTSHNAFFIGFISWALYDNVSGHEWYHGISFQELIIFVRVISIRRGLDFGNFIGRKARNPGNQMQRITISYCQLNDNKVVLKVGVFTTQTQLRAISSASSHDYFYSSVTNHFSKVRYETRGPVAGNVINA